MKYPRFAIVILFAFCALACTTINSTPKPPLVTKDPNAASGLYFVDNFYWVVGIPSISEGFLGKIYKVTKVKQGGNTETTDVYVESGVSAFPDLAVAQVVKEAVPGFSYEYRVKTDNVFGAALISAISTDMSAVNEVEMKVIATQGAKIKQSAIRAASIDSDYRKPEYYYVSEMYYGNSSYIGLQNTTFTAKGGFGGGTATVSATQYGNLHEVKEGWIICKLTACSTLKAAPAAAAPHPAPPLAGGPAHPLLPQYHFAPPSDLEDGSIVADLLKDGFKKMKQ